MAFIALWQRAAQGAPTGTVRTSGVKAKVAMVTKVGSDVFDGSVEARLAGLESSF